MSNDRPDPSQLQAFEAVKRASVAQLLFKGARLLNEQALSRVEAEGARLRLAHTRLLPHIDFEGVRPSVIAERAGITRQAVGQLLRDMEAEGLVATAPDPRDGRARVVRFTSRGLEALHHGMGVLGGLEAELAMALGPAHLERLREDLAALVELLERRAP